MTLAIIGAGLGRTGTASLRLALNSLGLPCYHMFDLAFDSARREDVDFWHGLGPAPRLTRADWNGLFTGYRAVLDYPACLFWRELMMVYPQAKVVLTLHPRGSAAWYDSTLETIYSRPSSAEASAFGQTFTEMMERLVWNGFFGGRFEDRDEAIARYEAHSWAVQAAVPAERLVVCTVAEGWAPICSALDLPVPDAPFPHSNERAEMARRVERLRRMKSFHLRHADLSDGTHG